LAERFEVQRRQVQLERGQASAIHHKTRADDARASCTRGDPRSPAARARSYVSFIKSSSSCWPVRPAMLKQGGARRAAAENGGGGGAGGRSARSTPLRQRQRCASATLRVRRYGERRG
jgi:hypothetical protein